MNGRSGTRLGAGALLATCVPALLCLFSTAASATAAVASPERVAAGSSVGADTNSCGGVYPGYLYLTGIMTNSTGEPLGTLDSSWDWNVPAASLGGLVPTSDPTVPDGQTDGICIWTNPSVSGSYTLEAWGYYVTADGAIWQLNIYEESILSILTGTCTQLNAELASSYTCLTSISGGAGSPAAQVNAKLIPDAEFVGPPNPRSAGATDAGRGFERYPHDGSTLGSATSLDTTVSNQTTNVANNPPDPAGTPESINVLDSWTVTGGEWTKPNAGKSPGGMTLPSGKSLSDEIEFALAADSSYLGSSGSPTVYGYFVTFDGTIWRLQASTVKPLVGSQISCLPVSHNDPAATPAMPSTACASEITSSPLADPVIAQATFVTP